MLAGGKSFTKLDLTSAYMMQELVETSKRLTYINTSSTLRGPDSILSRTWAASASAAENETSRRLPPRLVARRPSRDLGDEYPAQMSYFGNLMNQFIITSDNCSPSFHFRRSKICLDYNHCNTSKVIRLKECARKAVCYVAPTTVHCKCSGTQTVGVAEYVNLWPNCKEIDPRFFNDTLLTNSNLCPPGFYSNSRKFCIDLTCGRRERITINWCAVNRRCFVAPGNRYCACEHKPYSSKIKASPFSQRCIDVDECLTDPCGPQEVCTNIPGSFTCTNTTVIDQKQLDAKQCNFTHWDRQMQSSRYTFHQYCSVINSMIVMVNKQCQNQSGEPMLQEIISASHDLLRNDSIWDSMENEERFYLASMLLQSMENAAITAAVELPDQGRRVESTENIEMELRSFRGINASAPDWVRLQAKGNCVDICRSRVTTEKPTDVAAVALIVYKNMDFILNGSVFNLSTAGGKPKPFRLISNVVSAVITNGDKHGPNPTLNFTFKHTEEVIGDWAMHCVHWNFASGKSYWSPSGCSVGASNGTETQCRCNHLSSLALLMTPFEWQVEPRALMIITFIGIPVSLVCLAVTIGIFVFWKNLKSAITATHTQLCASLFLAELLFIVGINRTGNRVVCGIVAGFLHYFFLAAFVWMFLEGVQLFLMVRNIRQLRVPHSGKIEKYMYSFGYGVPAVIVVISAAVYHDGYGSSRHCWLQTRRKFIWSFLAPVCVIIGINTFLFLVTLCSLKKEVAKRNVAVSKLHNTRMLAFKAIAQVFILGCSWILGLFHFGEEAVVMAYLFTIVNSFQGTFIFIILCVLNPKVRAQFQKWFSVMFKTKKIVSPKHIAAIMPMTTGSKMVTSGPSPGLEHVSMQHPPLRIRCEAKATGGRKSASQEGPSPPACGDQVGGVDWLPICGRMAAASQILAATTSAPPLPSGFKCVISARTAHLQRSSGPKF
uniref:adhesion G protein-coupled receptor E3-like n=1 Tax=Pristiophorus japonicus TaxID=55135 RepID=UPI00398F4B87